MNKTLTTLALVVLSTFSLLAQDKIKGNKNVTIIETEVSPFNKLLIGEDFEVELKQDDYSSVQIETDDNLHDVINISVIDSVLSLKTDKRITKSKKMNIVIRYIDTPEDIVLEDNAEIKAAERLESPYINLNINDGARAFLNIRTYEFRLQNNYDSKLKLSSKSKLNIESTLVELQLNENSKTEALITCDTLKLDMYQRASAKIEGDVKHMRANTINSTDFTGKNLIADTCDLISEDNSELEIQVSDSLNIQASGRSDVTIYGNPKITINTFTNEAILRKREL